jgi:hypothetical protein
LNPVFSVGQFALGVVGLVISGVGLYIVLIVRVAVAELKTSISDLQLKITTEQRDREDRLREWADSAFIRRHT